MDADDSSSPTVAECDIALEELRASLNAEPVVRSFTLLMIDRWLDQRSEAMVQGGG
jgi:hypothetical protein